MTGGLVVGMDGPATQPSAPSRPPPVPWPARLLADSTHTSTTLFYLTLAAAAGGTAVALASFDALLVCVSLLPVSSSRLISASGWCC